MTADILLGAVECFLEREEEGAADFAHDADEVGVEVFFGIVLEVFDEEGRGELAGGAEVFAGVVVSAGAVAEAFDVGADADGVTGDAAVAFLETVEELGGDVLEVFALLIAEHDVARVAAIGGVFEGGEEILGGGVGVEECLAVGFGEVVVVDEGVVHEVVGELFERAGGCCGCWSGGGSGRIGCGRCGSGRCGRVLGKRAPREQCCRHGGRKDQTRQGGPLEHKASSDVLQKKVRHPSGVRTAALCANWKGTAFRIHATHAGGRGREADSPDYGGL